MVNTLTAFFENCVYIIAALSQSRLPLL